MNNKIAIGSLAGIFTLLAQAPESVKTSMYIVFFMVFIDTLTGIVAAIACKELRSASMRQKLTMKSVQYAILLTLTYAATMVSSTWLFYEGGLAAIMTIEATSLLENLSKFQKYSNVNLGVISHTLNFVSAYFQTNHEDQSTIVTTATMIPPRPDDQPIVSVSSVETTSRAGNSQPSQPKGNKL